VRVHVGEGRDADAPGLTAHGLRHSFASVAEDLGYTLPTIGALLGHAGNGMTASYIHKLDQVLFAAGAAVTIVWCASMSAKGEMPMPGGWTMSMGWMRMPGQTWS
jgi:hypothetical protein